MSIPRTRLVLFDIDGTLMITKGAGSRCILRACKRVFGDDFEWGPITVGTLDPQIFADLCAHNGIDEPIAHHEAYQRAYFDALSHELEARREDVTIMPGVAELLADLRGRDGVLVGVLTGNYRQAATIKLRAASFDMESFDCVVCAEDGDDRAALVAAAMARGPQAVEPGEVLVIGDTPRDVACAQANGCRSLAVATGNYRTDQLEEAGATYVVEDLTDRAQVDAAIGL